ncbi:MAG TPA: PHP-associated domain-containing protein, partial [Burkholderiales bacterium]|nr:PHP-associated domain-containing protein [Burkholderiales bacterium]
ICVPAHPYRNIGVASLLDDIHRLPDIAAVETHNGCNREDDNCLALAAAVSLKLPTLGGSDCHKANAVGRCATEFLQPVTDMSSFIAAIRAGACRGDYYPSAHAQQNRGTA